MAVATIDELKQIIGDIEALIESKLTEAELDHILKGEEFKKITEYVKENRTIPEDIHKAGSTNIDEILFGKLIDKLEKDQKTANRRAKMAGRDKVEDPRLAQAKQMQKTILGLKETILEEEIESEEFDIADYEAIKNKEAEKIQKDIDSNNNEITMLDDIKDVFADETDIKEYTELNSIKKAIEEYEKARKELEAETKKPDDKKDATKIVTLQAKLEDAKILIGYTGLGEKYKTVEIAGSDVSISDALKNNKDISSLVVKVDGDIAAKEKAIDAKNVDDIIPGFTGMPPYIKDEWEKRIANCLGKATIDDSDITAKNVMKIIDELTYGRNKIKRDNDKKIKEKEAKDSTIETAKRMGIIKDAEKMDSETLYDNYKTAKEEQFLVSMDSKKDRIEFWKRNLRGPFKWLRARFKARRGNIAETKAMAKASLVDGMIEKAKATKKLYTDSFRESLRRGIQLTGKDRVDALDKKDVYKTMESDLKTKEADDRDID